jgi:hypothetical protein
MAGEQLYEALTTEIKKKFFKNSQLVNSLVETLFIEKEAVYRRLRGEVPFTFSEIATITKNLGISLDTIIGIEIQKSRPFQLKLMNFVSPKEIDYYLLESFFDFLHQSGEMENSEMGVVTNVLPQDLFSGFYYLTKFNLFHWNYHHSRTAKTFHDLIVPEKMMEAFRKQFVVLKNISKTHYVFDNQVFQHFTNDIKYFNSIRLIEKEDMIVIKEELIQFLDYLENLSINGKFQETGNIAYLYISDIDVTTNYCYIEAGDAKLSLVRTFLLTSVVSTDEPSFESMKNWIQSFIKISNLITVAGEKQRILYFEKQRKIINEL